MFHSQDFYDKKNSHISLYFSFKNAGISLARDCDISTVWLNSNLPILTLDQVTVKLRTLSNVGWVRTAKEC